MEAVTWAVLASVLGVVVSLCSIASFYFGRRKAATEEAKEDGRLSTDLKYIKDIIKDTNKSLDALAIRLDAQNRQQEEDYRQLLVKLTELGASYKSLHIRVDNVEKQISQYHHTN